MVAKRILIALGLATGMALLFGEMPMPLGGIAMFVIAASALYRDLVAARRRLTPEEAANLAGAVLFLRPFGLDPVDVKKAYASLGTVIPFYRTYLAARGTQSFDRLLADSIESRIGPLVALSSRDFFAPVSARAIDTTGVDWKPLVLELMRKAKAILVVAGTSAGLRMEIELLHREIDPRKVFLLSPYEIAWGDVRRSFGAIGWVVPREDPGRQSVIAFDGAFEPHVLTTTASEAHEVVSVIERWLHMQETLDHSMSVRRSEFQPQPVLPPAVPKADDSYRKWRAEALRHPMRGGIGFVLVIVLCMVAGTLAVALAAALHVPPFKWLFAAIFFGAAAGVFHLLAPLPYRAELEKRRRWREALRRAAPALGDEDAAFVEAAVRQTPVMVNVTPSHGQDVVVETPLHVLAMEAQRRYIAMRVGAGFREESRGSHREAAIVRESVRVRVPANSEETFVFDVTTSTHDPLRALDGEAAARVAAMVLPAATFRITGTKRGGVVPAVMGCGGLLCVSAGALLLVMQTAWWLSRAGTHWLLLSCGVGALAAGFFLAGRARTTDMPLRPVRSMG